MISDMWAETGSPVQAHMSSSRCQDSYWAERTLRLKEMEPARASLLHEFQAPVNMLRFTFDLRALTSRELVALQLQSLAWSTATCIFFWWLSQKGLAAKRCQQGRGDWHSES